MLILHVLSWLYNADNQSLTLRFRQCLERLLSEWHEATYRDLRLLAAQFLFFAAKHNEPSEDYSTASGISQIRRYTLRNLKAVPRDRIKDFANLGEEYCRQLETTST